MTNVLPGNIRGVQFWAVSYCRSTLGFYEALAQILGLPFRVCLARGGIGARGELGFDEAEFAHLDIIETEDEEVAIRALDQYPDWLQVFGTYQSMPHIRATLKAALQQRAAVGIASEAPCNMESPGLRRAAKAAYISHLLPHRVAEVTKHAQFILNWSGDDAKSLVALGWPREKIIPLGYFPPPLPGTTFRTRDEEPHVAFRILCSGGLTWHRGPDLLIEALILLKSWGVSFEATFTGHGPLEMMMQERAKAAGLPVQFLGRVPMENLITLYETCSVFVAPGRQEPWGIRVNDALNAGAPTVVSRGMGAVKLVDDYSVGLSFEAGDVTDLAWQLRWLATDRSRYIAICSALSNAQAALLPRAAAARAAPHITTLLEREHAM
ncbi:glycosyltransferase family 4 protein [Pseudosulfitobacter pseudonitzschiae]|uniref:glycosyltransferase family 4 protein n=1 Tax=Pseudosulfitobacter pseudonitzschiae TaxID=1402135 RepID=UPI003B7F3B74